MFPFFNSSRIAALASAFILLSPYIGATGSSAQEAKQSIRPASEIETIIRDYILKNPEIIIEALQILEERREVEQNELQKQLIARNEDVLLTSEHQTVFGNPNGDVTLIEFFDYNCGFCRESLSHVERLVKEDPNLRVILKEFPVLGQGSQDAARVAIAASKIDPVKYLQLHMKLLSAREQADQKLALKIAENVGYDMEKIREYMAKPAIEEAISEVYGIANDLGLTGTPTFIIGTEILPGAVGHDVLREKLDSMRKCGETVCS